MVVFSMRVPAGLLFLLLLSIGCGDDDGSADVGTDTSADVETDSAEDAQEDAPEDVGVDAFVVETPPSCAPAPMVTPPACGTAAARASLIPGPRDPEHDAALASKADAFDRAYRLIAKHTGTNSELVVGAVDDRERIAEYIAGEADLPATLTALADRVQWTKVAGAYAGAGATADAFRYAALRDEGAACEEVEAARATVIAAAEAVHRAFAITGTPGVVARGYQRNDLHPLAHEIVPLFDEAGDPLPEEKNNGTWRADVSGEYPEYDWEDSCSRDMLIGWVWGLASLHEVVRGDATFPEEVRQTLEADALALARSLMREGAEGYDLEIHDADGRRTFHGTLHESAIDRVYLPRFRGNAQHATMALGIMAALARVTGDEETRSYVHNELVRRRELHLLIRDMAGIIDFGRSTNFSNYNMSFTGAWLASRYLCGDSARAAVNEGITRSLYGTEDDARHPIELGQTFFDVVYLHAESGMSLDVAPASIETALASSALSRGEASLRGFATAPYWNTGVENCDADEIEALRCVAVDGVTLIELEEERGRNDLLIATRVVPFGVRPPSNYHWRSDPHRVNGDGGGNVLYSGVDFRVAYWTGRFLQRE